MRIEFTLALAASIVAVMARGAEPKPSLTGVTVNPEKRTVTVAAKVAPRKLPKLDQVYPVELIAGWGAPRGAKAHEIVVAIDVNPSEVHKGLEALGLKPGKPAKGENAKAEGPLVNVFFEVPAADGSIKRLSMDKVLLDPKSKKPAPKMTFRFTGSVMSATDPNKPNEKKYGADLTGTLIALFPVTDETVLQTDWTMKEEKYLKLDVNAAVLPKEGSPIKLVIEVPKK
ncbi:MAG TPA: YdjY domain-containing protein [Urbifossiella sp.]|nr:YdjY domain-containing protein [Urbifossiella sp.]